MLQGNKGIYPSTKKSSYGSQCHSVDVKIFLELMKICHESIRQKLKGTKALEAIHLDLNAIAYLETGELAQ